MGCAERIGRHSRPRLAGHICAPVAATCPVGDLPTLPSTHGLGSAAVEREEGAGPQGRHEQGGPLAAASCGAATACSSRPRLAARTETVLARHGHGSALGPSMQALRTRAFGCHSTLPQHHTAAQTHHGLAPRMPLTHAQPPHARGWAAVALRRAPCDVCCARTCRVFLRTLFFPPPLCSLSWVRRFASIATWTDGADVN